VLVLAAGRNDLSLKIRVIRGLPRRSLGREGTASTLQRFNGEAIFPHNLAPDFLQYMSERPEMASSKRGVKEGQNNRKKIKS